jgi:hypothetical protein
MTRRYRPCSIGRSRRSTDDLVAIKNVIKQVLKKDNPQTVRQVFYQLVTRGVIDKTEKDYHNVVIRLLTSMRESGAVPFQWIIDSGRTTHNTQTYDNISDAVKETADFYRRSALRESNVYIEIWVEKDALSGIVWDAASDYDVPVVVSKGMPSLSQMYSSFQNIHRATSAGKECFIYQFGDHDPTGTLIPKVIEDRMDWFCRHADCAMPTVERYALTKEQIKEHDLPTRPTKTIGNSHAADFRGRSVELDALSSVELRRLVHECIGQHISQNQVDTLREAEESERDLLRMWARGAPR